MTTRLEDLLGEGFTKEYEQAVAKKIAERDRISEEELEEIKSTIKEAADNNAIDPEDPKFRVGRNDVLLVQAPNDLERFTRVFENGGRSVTFMFTGNYISLLSNNAEVFEDVEPGEFYFAIGRYTERMYNGVKRYQISPCRYLLSLNDLITEKMMGNEGSEGEGNQIEKMY